MSEHKELASMSKVIAAMQAEIDRLKAALDLAHQVQEEIACGTKLVCVRCGQPKPCSCDKS